MKAKKQEDNYKLTSASQFRAIYKSTFFMERKNVPSPKPSQNYHYHDCYEMYYLYSGERYYFIKDKTYHVKGGALVFIEPYTIHCSANFEEYGFDRLLFNFKREFIDDLLSAVGAVDPFECYEKNSHVIQLDLHERGFAEMLFETMMQEYESGGEMSEAYLKSSLVQLLLYISKNEHQLEAPPLDYANPTHKMISEITGYINNNYKENITLASISELFHISPCYFSRAFKNSTGFSFTQYLNNVRIKESQKLLAGSNMSILEISEAVGFNSNTHFGRVFKGIIGMAPLAYKSSITKKQ